MRGLCGNVLRACAQSQKALGVSIQRLVSYISTGQGLDARLYGPQLLIVSMHDTLTHHLAWICERPWGECRSQQPVLGQDAGAFALYQVWFCAFETL